MLTFVKILNTDLRVIVAHCLKYIYNHNCETPEAQFEISLKHLNSGVRVWGPRVGNN